MTVTYQKDALTKITAINTQTVIDSNDLHDSFGRYFVPDGKPFRVLFECLGKQQVAALGVGKASTGKVCPIRIKVRIEPPADEPKASDFGLAVEEII